MERREVLGVVAWVLKMRLKFENDAPRSLSWGRRGTKRAHALASVARNQ